MAEQGHTPWPWSVEDRLIIGRQYGYDVISDLHVEHGVEIALVFPCGGRMTPNARLIAAAPELLVALKYAINSLEAMRPTFSQVKDEGHAFHDQVIDTVRAAIAKAEGGAS